MNEDKDKLIAELKAEVSMLRKILSMLPWNVFWKNSKGEYLGCNLNVANTLQLQSPDDIIGKNDFELIRPEAAEKALVIDREVLETGQEKIVEQTGLDSEGNTAIYLTCKTPLYGIENEKCILGVSVDITERKQMEINLKIAKQKAEEANRAKSRFLAMITHELRTPLANILGFTKIIREENLDSIKRNEYLRHINHSGHYLLSLINNLLDYARLETKKFEINASPINLKKLMEETINMLNSTASAKNLILSLNYDASVPENIITDGSVLRQILINLIGNAIKFTEKGHVTLHVKYIKTISQKVQLQIAVEDTGIGISAQDQKLIFKQFYQVSNVYTHNMSLTGTGLGLAIVKKLVKLLNSKIQVKSVPDQGSTFSFVVSFPINLNTSMLTNQNSPIQESHIVKNLSVLIVEDNELIQIIHKKMLEELGCTVDIAESAKKALTILKESHDVLFVDIGLPDINGFELIKTIRQSEIGKKIPIIALTGYSEEEERQHCLQAGANDVAVKPISSQMLEELLERYVVKVK